MKRDYRKIVAWQQAHQLVLSNCKATQVFPKLEIYGLTTQIRRVASSVPANIVEGSGRESAEKKYLRFLDIAYDSLKETGYFLLLSRDLDYLDTYEYERLSKILDSTFAPLHGLIKSLKANLKVQKPQAIVQKSKAN